MITRSSADHWALAVYSRKIRPATAQLKSPGKLTTWISQKEELRFAPLRFYKDERCIIAGSLKRRGLERQGTDKRDEVVNKEGYSRCVGWGGVGVICFSFENLCSLFDILPRSPLETAACGLNKTPGSAADTGPKIHNRLELHKRIWQIRPGRVRVIVSDSEDGGAQWALAKNDQLH